MSYTNAAADHGSETHQAMTGTDLTADSEQTRALYRERAQRVGVVDTAAGDGAAGDAEPVVEGGV